MPRKKKSSLPNIKRILPNAKDTNKVLPASVSEEKQKKVQIGRPVTKGHRKHFNTMLDPVIKRKLNIIAAMEEKTLADILETVLTDYISSEYPNVK